MKNGIILLLIAYFLYMNVSKKTEVKNYFYLKVYLNDTLSTKDSLNIRLINSFKKKANELSVNPLIYPALPKYNIQPDIKLDIDTTQYIGIITPEKEVIKEPSQHSTQYHNANFSYTEDDIYNLAKVIQNESGGDTLDQYRVGQTILNRIALTIEGTRDFTGLNKEGNINNIIKAPSQFNSVWKSVIPTQASIKRAEKIARYDIPLECYHKGLYFYNPNNSAEPSSWIRANKRKRVAARSKNGHIHTF